MSSALSATQAAKRIREGTLRSETLIQECLERIEAREPQVGAWEYLDPDSALRQARAADRGPSKGALHGVPIGIKDIIDTADMPTTLGSPIYRGRQPQWDAACVAAARAAGAIVLGKTVSTEFAYFQAGKTRNPHSLLHTPGGSSSGSAAAVADGMVPLAFGSQTAASLTRPAAFCGVFGYKASLGELSLSGIRPFAESLDSLGILARSVSDIVLLRTVLIGARHGALDDVAPTLGLCRTAQWELADPCGQAAVELCAERLARSGARVIEVELPTHFAALIDAHKCIMAYEAAHNYVYEINHFALQLSEAFRALLETGAEISRDSYLRAKLSVTLATAELPSCFGKCDALIAPSAIGEAPLASDGTGDPVMSRMWTALQLPSLAVPLSHGPSGLPLGMQLITLRHEDDALLRVGEWVSRKLEMQ